MESLAERIRRPMEPLADDMHLGKWTKHIFGKVVPKCILKCIVLNSFYEKPLF
jgi:hypothetical protein